MPDGHFPPPPITHRDPPRLLALLLAEPVPSLATMLAEMSPSLAAIEAEAEARP
jgi:hypothetical protein